MTQLTGCRFPSDCLDALDAVDKSFWKIVPAALVEHDHQPIQGRFWLANSRLLPSAINSTKYYHCVVERKLMCAQSPLAVEASKAILHLINGCYLLIKESYTVTLTDVLPFHFLEKYNTFPISFLI